LLRDYMPGPARSGGTTLFERLMAEAILASPAFTLRGGTSEVLRTMIARQL
jgi:hypothetical protein